VSGPAAGAVSDMDRSRLSAGQRLLLVGVWNTLIMALGAPRPPAHADEGMSQSASIATR